MGDCHSAFRRLALRGRGPPPEGQRQIRPPAPAPIVGYAGRGGSRGRDHVPCLHQRDVGVPERFAVLGNVKPRLQFQGHILAGGAEEAGRDRQRLKGEHAAHAQPVLGFVMPHLRFGFGTLRDAERAPRGPGFRIGLRHGDPFADEIPGKPGDARDHVPDQPLDVRTGQTGFGLEEAACRASVHERSFCDPGPPHSGAPPPPCGEGHPVIRARLYAPIDLPLCGEGPPHREAVPTMRRNAPKAHPEQVPADEKSRKRRAAGNRLRRETGPEEGHRNRGPGKGKGMDEGTGESRNASPRTGKGQPVRRGPNERPSVSLRVGKGVRREAY